MGDFYYEVQILSLICFQFKITVIEISVLSMWRNLIFYKQLGVQIVEICMATRPRNGGLFSHP